jgi:hypothetical protein
MVAGMAGAYVELCITHFTILCTVTCLRALCEALQPLRIDLCWLGLGAILVPKP